jgi:hypothetical protein
MESRLHEALPIVVKVALSQFRQCLNEDNKQREKTGATGTPVEGSR